MKQIYKINDFFSNEEIKWCTGCGNYSILRQIQSVLSDICIEKEKIVFVSGIGCSSRLPYYMHTYGLHGIHGRAPAIATGMKLANPDLNIWIITGDGDGFSIGCNHIIHLLRRNIDVNLLIFNNEIYGLTKGQYSPTSSLGLKTKSSTLSNIDYPLNILSLALGAEATFLARSLDKNPKHLREMLLLAHKHKGASLLEIYQNCNIFNNKAFDFFSKKEYKYEHTIFIKNGAPLVFGERNEKGILLDGLSPKIVDLDDGYILEDLWLHDVKDRTKASILTRFLNSEFPTPFGVIYQEDRNCSDIVFKEKITYLSNINKENLIKKLYNIIS